MDNETLFYICGIGLAVSAVVISFVGLKAKNFPGKAFPAVILWFAILVGATTTFAVLHAKDEEQEKAAEFEKAGKEIEADQTTAPFETEGAQGGGEAEAEEEVEAEAEEPTEPVGPEGDGKKSAASGPGATLQLTADASAIAYDTTSLTSKPGKVTIDFDNPAPLEHDVAIEGEDGKEIAGSELVAEAKTSVSAELAPGTYTFFCTVPGHRQVGGWGEGRVTLPQKPSRSWVASGARSESRLSFCGRVTRPSDNTQLGFAKLLRGFEPIKL